MKTPTNTAESGSLSCVINRTNKFDPEEGDDPAEPPVVNLTRTKRLLLAALRVWELKNGIRPDEYSPFNDPGVEEARFDVRSRREKRRQIPLTSSRTKPPGKKTMTKAHKSPITSLPRRAATAASIVALFFAYAAAQAGSAAWRANLISTDWNTAANQIPIDRRGPIPILAFSFDNVTSSNVADDSGSGNLYTSEAMDADGLFRPTTDASFRGSGKALHLDGTRQQRIEIAGSALTVQAFTIMADVRLSDPVNFTDPALERWEICEKAGSYWANIRMDQGLVIPGPPYLLRVGGFFDGTVDTSFLGVTGLTPGRWTNVALVFDPVAHTLSSYINGVLD